MTPRKLMKLWGEHKRFNNWETKDDSSANIHNGDFYIDQLSWL